MKYEVRCECGKAHAVSGADAGATIRCACGRLVEVPPLHRLRSVAGQRVLSPMVRIQTLLLAGKLPGTNVCVSCRAATQQVVDVLIECESATFKEGTPSTTDAAVGLALGVLDGLQESTPARDLGPGERVIVPLPVCDLCGRFPADASVLRRALRQIPEYAALLDQYPNARIVVK
jgi:hypothetical protein